MSNRYLTVAEVAERVGISKQAVYQRLSKDLNKYVKVIDNKKMLNISVLSEFELKQEPTNSKEAVNSLTSDNKEIDSNLQLLNIVIDTLKNQLEIKDTQIRNLNDRLEQALSNQSQNNYIMAQQAKMLEETSSAQENVTLEPKKTLWDKICRK